jgi:hypothetical protein
VVKICVKCHEVSPGGFRCDHCGGALVHTDSQGARDLPEEVWKQQRVDYGARRGMVVRFNAIFLGAVLGLWGVRASFGLDAPWCYLAGVGSLLGGVFVWWMIYVWAGKAVRVWVLRRGQLHRRKMAKALLSQAVSTLKRPG